MLWSVELQAKYSGLCNFKKNTRINFNSCQGAEIEIDYYFQLQIIVADLLKFVWIWH